MVVGSIPTSGADAIFFQNGIRRAAPKRRRCFTLGNYITSEIDKVQTLFLLFLYNCFIPLAILRKYRTQTSLKLLQKDRCRINNSIVNGKMLRLQLSKRMLKEVCGNSYFSGLCFTRRALSDAKTSEEDLDTFELLPPGCSMVDPTYGLKE